MVIADGALVLGPEWHMRTCEVQRETMVHDMGGSDF